MLTFGDCVECRNLLGCQTHRHDLHRLGTTTGSPASPALQLLDVIASLNGIRRLADIELAVLEANGSFSFFTCAE